MLSTPQQIRRSSVALIAVAALLLSACSGGDKKASTTSAVPSTDTKGKPNVSLALQLGSLQVQAVDAAKPFDRPTAQKIQKVVNDYINTGVARPLFTGALSAGLVRYFTPALAPRVGTKGRDRLALTDEHEPVITSVTSVDKQPLILTGLQLHGRFIMIGARFGITVKGTTDQGPLSISRIGNLVFEPDAKHEWHISGYNLIVNRDTSTSSTTAKATTTTAAKS
jgi:hypothetical protein